MSTFFNHAHFPILEYNLHTPAKYQAMEKFGGLDGGRVLACSLPGDIVQLDPRLREQYDYLKDHLGRAGLELGEVIFDADPAAVKRYPDHDLSVYAFNSTFHAIQPDIERYETYTMCNDKNQFIAWCYKLGLPIPRTYVSNYGPVYDLADIPMPALIKPSRASAGIGIERVTTKKELAAYLGHIGDRFPYQVQEELEGAVFFSEQYELSGGTKHLATTGLSSIGFEYDGNFYPSVHNAREITDVAAETLRRRGLKGPFGFDMAAAPDGEKLIECNPRYTGATYPVKVSHRLDIPFWMTCKLPTGHRRLENIEIDDLTYDPTIRAGAIIMHAGQLLTDKPNLAFLIAGDPKTQTEIRSELEGRLTGV